MNTEAKSYKVTILNKEYSLVSDESEKHIKEAAELVDTLMGNLKTASKSADTQLIAVLAALQIASKLLHKQGQHEKQKKDFSDLVVKIDQHISTL